MYRMIKSFYIVILVFLVISPILLSAQSHYYCIGKEEYTPHCIWKIKVYDEYSGKPLRGAKVEIYTGNKYTYKIFSIETDNEGIAVILTYDLNKVSYYDWKMKIHDKDYNYSSWEKNITKDHFEHNNSKIILLTDSNGNVLSWNDPNNYPSSYKIYNNISASKYIMYNLNKTGNFYYHGPSLYNFNVPLSRLYKRNDNNDRNNTNTEYNSSNNSYQKNKSTYNNKDLRNVALSSTGSVAKAISEGYYHGTRYALNANDGDSKSGWASQWSMPAWLIIDFKNKYYIETIGIWWGSHKHTFSVSLSENGSNWKTVISSRTSNNYEGSSPVHELFSINPTFARYIKINISTTSAPSSHIFQAIVNELEAYSTTTYSR